VHVLQHTQKKKFYILFDHPTYTYTYADCPVLNRTYPCFKILFPASTPVLLCYILIIHCISETQTVFFRSHAKSPGFPLTHFITADFSMNIKVKQLVPD